eukprot:12909628-Prorocentrum_lima.AAC.1
MSTHTMSASSPGRDSSRGAPPGPLCSLSCTPSSSMSCTGSPASPAPPPSRSPPMPRYFPLLG